MMNLTPKPLLTRKAVQDSNQSQAGHADNEGRRKRPGSPGGVRIQCLHQDAKALKKNSRSDHREKIDAGHGGTGHLGRNQVFDVGVH